MTILYRDDFDRVGALGAAWSIPSGTFACDGAFANMTGNIVPAAAAVTYRALFVGSGAALETSLDVTMRIRMLRPTFGTDTTLGVPTNVGTLEVGVVFAAQVTDGVQHELIHDGTSLIWRQRNYGIGGGVTAIINGQATIAWTAGTWKEIKIVRRGAPQYDCSIYLDSVLILNNSFFAIPTFSNRRGLLAVYSMPATIPAHVQTPPGLGSWDSFSVSNPIVLNIEPTPAAESTTQQPSISFATTPATVGLSIKPDSGWEEPPQFSTRRSKQAGGAVVRHPKTDNGTRTFRLAWTNRTLAARTASMAEWESVITGLLNFTYTTPEGEALVLTPASAIVITKPGPDGWSWTATAVISQ